MAQIVNWPPDYDAEILYRFQLLEYINSDSTHWPILREHYSKKEAQSCIDWINAWCVTFDPRAVSPTPKLMPFIMFPRQEDFVHFILGCLWDKEHGLVEKARDMGATWLCCAISVWLFLFHPGSTVGWGSLLSHNIDDRGNPKSIFLKIRQIIQYLPWFMLPEGMTQREHMPLMKILHPTDTATIIGEGGDNVGRGGRTTLYFKDESAHYERPELIEAALGDNTDVQIDISSVNGTNNVFYQKRMAGEVWYRDKPIQPGILRVFIFDWSEHPAKTQAWYNKRRNKAASEGLLHIFAQEVERNYSSAVDRIIIPAEWVNASVDAHRKLKIKVEGEKVAGQDVADEGGDKNALVIRHSIVCRFADSSGGDPGDAAASAIPICKEYGVSELYYDSIGVGAGFKVAINNMKEKEDDKGNSTFPRNLLVMPWNAGAKPLDPDDPIIPGDLESLTNDEMYENLKAQSWFRIRSRFFKTYRMVTFGEVYALEELISIDSSIPKLQELKNELSQAQYKSSKNGKTIVDKKPNGAKSPNLADGFVMCYSPTRELSILDVL